MSVQRKRNEIVRFFKLGANQEAYKSAVALSHEKRQTVSYLIHTILGIDPHELLSRIQHDFSL